MFSRISNSESTEKKILRKLNYSSNFTLQTSCKQNMTKTLHSSFMKAPHIAFWKKNLTFQSQISDIVFSITPTPLILFNIETWWPPPPLKFFDVFYWRPLSTINKKFILWVFLTAPLSLSSFRWMQLCISCFQHDTYAQCTSL